MDLDSLCVLEICDERDDRVSALEEVAAELVAWRSGVDGYLDDVRLELKRLSKHWDKVVYDSSVVQPGVLTLPPMVAGRHLPEKRPTRPTGTASI